MNTKLYIIRHGITKANIRGLCLGWTNSSLTDESKLKIRKLSRKLKKLAIDVVFCSDLKRTRETFKIIQRQIGDKNVKFTKRLRELNFGVYEMKKPQKIKETQPEIYDKNGFFKFNKKLKNGESLKDLSNRCKSFLNSIKAKRIRGNLLIITHGSIILMLHSIIKNKSYNYYFKKLNLNSCKVFKLDFAQRGI